jgi:hypothetical protein
VFRPSACDETKLRRDETIIGFSDDIRKWALAIVKPTKRAAKAQGQGIVMIKALSALAIAAFITAALTVLPGFAPQVEASVPHTLAKADRLDIRTVGRKCSQQAWPNFEASCLRVAGTKTPDTKTVIREARIVTADRTPQGALSLRQKVTISSHGTRRWADH